MAESGEEGKDREEEDKPEADRRDSGSDKPESERSALEGFVDGYVETILSPFKWAGSLFGGLFG